MRDFDDTTFSVPPYITNEVEHWCNILNDIGVPLDDRTKAEAKRLTAHLASLELPPMQNILQAELSQESSSIRTFAIRSRDPPNNRSPYHILRFDSIISQNARQTVVGLFKALEVTRAFKHMPESNSEAMPIAIGNPHSA